jgi:hypothetical protein
MPALLLGIPGATVIDMQETDDKLDLLIETEARPVRCPSCGCSVDTDLIHPDGHHYADDGDFYCADCWEEESR